MRVYVASSWRNEQQPVLVAALRAAGHEVYDFRHPSAQGPGGAPDGGFSWSEIDQGWRTWTPGEFRGALGHAVARRGYAADTAAMRWAEAFVLLLPCGRSAHLELGWAAGRGKRTCVLLDEGFEPELMYKMVDRIAVDLGEVVEWLGECGGGAR